MTISKSETTSDQSGLELSNLVRRRTGHVPTILRERLGVTGTMELLQRFESKVYENGCNALTAACNASRSLAILVHTICFALEQTRDDSCIPKHSSSVRNTSNKSTKHENRPSQHLRNIVTGCFPSTLLVKCFYFILTSVATREGFRAAQFLLRCWSV